ncbi:MAG: hypothetical protein CR217_09340 [Beijerinckiaceae bacterium]|nr:MAG: hypothetical protein CR217_09340 [Beijerinckiaceae bacterium]
MDKKPDLKTEIELLWLRKREVDEKLMAQHKAWADETRLIYKRIEALEHRRKFIVVGMKRS